MWLSKRSGESLVISPSNPFFFGVILLIKRMVTPLSFSARGLPFFHSNCSFNFFNSFVI